MHDLIAMIIALLTFTLMGVTDNGYFFICMAFVFPMLAASESPFYEVRSVADYEC